MASLAVSPMNKLPISRTSSTSGRPSLVDPPDDTWAALLTDTAPITPFTTIDKLFKQIDDTGALNEDCLIVTDISPEDFVAIDKERDKRMRKFRFRRYYANYRILIVSIPTIAHERAHARLYLILGAMIVNMGLSGSWDEFHAATFYQEGYPGGSSGEGDSAGGPAQRSKDDGWPTLVIESGYSQTLHALQRVIRWWFSASEHAVKIVILVKIDRRQPKIILERWQEEASGPRQGATITRFSSVLAPQLMQSITITRDDGMDIEDLNAYHVDRQDLVLEFRLLFLRDPAPGEGNLIFGEQDLKEYARSVWRSLSD